MNVVDLFCGCGGLSTGFHNNKNFNIIVANDIWADAMETYRANFPQTKTILGSICDEAIKQEIITLAQKKCDLIIGGPPCQAYSMAGARDPNDPRAKLFEDYLALVKALNPKYCIMENVKGILSATYESGKPTLKLKKTTVNLNGKVKIKVIDKITAEFQKLNYHVNYKVLNSADYGVPQKRERLILIASRMDVPVVSHPAPSHSGRWVSVRTAIDDLKSRPEDEAFSHILTKHSPEVIQKIGQTACGQSMNPKYKEAFYKCPPDEPSLTVKENHGGVFLHYERLSVMTPRELARLQSFPDTFAFKGTKSSILKQIGNAVPVKLGSAISDIF
jgi:DNA (cytosine-5)-methyltransferase 1